MKTLLSYRLLMTLCILYFASHPAHSHDCVDGASVASGIRSLWIQPGRISPSCGVFNPANQQERERYNVPGCPGCVYQVSVIIAGKSEVRRKGYDRFGIGIKDPYTTSGPNDFYYDSTPVSGASGGIKAAGQCDEVKLGYYPSLTGSGALVVFRGGAKVDLFYDTVDELNNSNEAQAWVESSIFRSVEDRHGTIALTRPGLLGDGTSELEAYPYGDAIDTFPVQHRSWSVSSPDNIPFTTAAGSRGGIKIKAGLQSGRITVTLANTAFSGCYIEKTFDVSLVCNANLTSVEFTPLTRLKNNSNSRTTARLSNPAAFSQVLWQIVGDNHGCTIEPNGDVHGCTRAGSVTIQAREANLPSCVEESELPIDRDCGMILFARSLVANAGIPGAVPDKLNLGLTRRDSYGQVAWRISSEDHLGCEMDADSGTLTAGNQPGTLMVEVYDATDSAACSLSAPINIIPPNCGTIIFSPDHIFGDGQSVSMGSLSKPELFSDVTWSIVSGDTPQLISDFIDLGDKVFQLQSGQSAGSAIVRGTDPNNPACYAEGKIYFDATCNSAIAFDTEKPKADGKQRTIAVLTQPDTFTRPVWSITGNALGCTVTPVSEWNPLTETYTANAAYIISGLLPGRITIRVSEEGHESDCYVEASLELETDPCSENNCSDCGFGGGRVANNSVDITIDLGKANFGSLAGFLRIKTDRPDPAIFTPAGLQLLQGSEDVHGIFLSELPPGASSPIQVIRQVRTPVLFADIVTIGSSSGYNSEFQVRIYKRSDASLLPVNVDGTHSINPSAAAISVWRIRQPSGTGVPIHHLHVHESRSGSEVGRAFQWNGTAWNLLSTKNVQLVHDGRYRVGAVESHFIQFQLIPPYLSLPSFRWNVESEESKEYYNFPWGPEVIKETTGSGPNQLITRRTYYDSSTPTYPVPSNFYRKLKSIEYPTGYWETYAYDNKGRVTRIVSQHSNNPMPTMVPSIPPMAPGHAFDGTYIGQEDVNRVTTIIYNDNDITSPYKTFTVTLGSNEREVERRYELVSANEHHYLRCQTPGASHADPSNLREVVWSLPLDHPQFPGEPLKKRYPDGTMSFFENSIINDQKTTTIRSGVPNTSGTDVVEGIKTTIRLDRAGNNIFTKTYDIGAEPSERLLTSRVTIATDAFGRPERVQLTDGTVIENIRGCCGVEHQADSSGVTTDFEYDNYRRIRATTSGGVRMEFEHDAADRVIKGTRKGNGMPDIVVDQLDYDTSGRLISSMNSLNQVTQFTENKSGSLTLRTTTYPNGSTRIETFNSDGTIASVDGTAVHPRLKYEYGFDAEGTYVKEIRLNGTSETEWVKRYRNMLGEVRKIVYPPNSSAQTPYSEYTYFSGTGKLKRQRDQDGVITLFAYNNKGEIYKTAIDSNRNDVFDPGLDRISYVERKFEMSGTTPISRETRQVSDWLSEVEVLVTTGVDDISTDGRDSWSTRSGQTTHTRVDYPQPPGQKLVTETFPDQSMRLSRYVDGRLESVTRKDPSGNQITKTSYVYDPHGRLWKSIDARNGETIYEYFNDDRLKSVTTPVPGQGQATAQKTSYAYDDINPQGRTETITLPDQTTLIREYFLTGELKKTSGSRVTPVAYAYDDQGRARTMTTWQSFGTATPGDAVTTWNYSPDRGFLVSKLDNASKGTVYEYKDSGRLSTRTWARGLKTRYTYNDVGELWKTDYGDDGSVDRTFEYDLRSQLKTVTDSTGKETLSYEDDGQLLSETFSGTSPLAGFKVESAYGSYRRRDTLTVSQGAAPVLQQGFGYDSSSRLQTVSAGNFLATYQHLPNSQLAEYVYSDVAGSRVMTMKKTFNNLDTLKETKSYGPSGTDFAKHAYDYTDANQRRKVTLADGSYWDYLYDSLGQLSSGKKYWADGTPVAGQQFEYTFDTIGNRKQTRAGGNEAGANLRTSDYTPDVGLLNRYAQRTVPGAVDIAGSAHPEAFITVNSQTPYRKDSYYRLELPVNNVGAAAYPSVTVNALRNNAGTGGADVTDTRTGNIFVPQNPELFSQYDFDGNLVTDGRWTYTWDAENQLYEMVETSPAIPALDRKKLRFTYDFLGRRTQKTVLRAQDNAVISKINFVYHGGNLLAELNGLNGNALLRSYVWGRDLSGTSHGAGGVGGLLAIRDGLGAYHSVAYDGNGNVSALVAANGSISAQYFYGPFGELIAARGPLGLANPIRYSTKYTDDESDLVYYGRRYYAPANGRWLNLDPIGEGGDLNLYRAFANAPTDTVDRDGQDNMYALPNPFVSLSVQNAPVNIGITLPNAYQQVYIPPPTFISAPGTRVPSIPGRTILVPTYDKSFNTQFLGTDPAAAMILSSPQLMAGAGEHFFQSTLEPLQLVKAFDPTLTWAERNEAFFRGSSAALLMFTPIKCRAANGGRLVALDTDTLVKLSGDANLLSGLIRSGDKLVVNPNVLAELRKSLGWNDPESFLALHGISVAPTTPGASVPASVLRQQLDAFKLHRGNLGDALNISEAGALGADVFITGDLSATRALLGSESGGLLRLPRSDGTTILIQTVK